MAIQNLATHSLVVPLSVKRIRHRFLIYQTIEIIYLYVKNTSCLFRCRPYFLQPRDDYYLYVIIRLYRTVFSCLSGSQIPCKNRQLL